MSKVTIYTGYMCGYCTRAKKLLDSKNIDFTEINIFEKPEKKEEMLILSNGKKTVPQIFIGNTHIGGWNDLNELQISGNLDSILINQGIK